MGLNLFKKKEKNHIKQRIVIRQKDRTLEICGEVGRKDYLVSELWLKSRDEEVSYKIAQIEPNNKFSFNVPLDELLKVLTTKAKVNVFDFFLKIRRPYTNSDKKNGYELIGTDGQKYVEYFIRLGRFMETDISNLIPYKHKEQFLINYLTIKGNLSLIINEEPMTPINIQIDKIKRSNSTIKLIGKIFTKSSNIVNGRLLLKGRNTNAEYSINTIKFQKMYEETKRKYGLNRYQYEAEINFKELGNENLLGDDVYDLFVSLKLDDHFEERVIRVGRPTFRAQLQLKDLTAKNGKLAIFIHPYFTFKKANLSFEVYQYDLEAYKYLQKVIHWSWLIQLKYRKKNVWLVGERTYKAQDTGYAFFKYMREKHPEMDVYYVIDKDSPEKKNVAKYGNVLDYKSKKHIFYSIIAKKVISSHHPDYLYPIRTRKFKNKVKADKIFLQHGVMGTKNMVANYGKNAPSGFDADFFIVSSDFEKDMIVKDFGYDPEQVFVTGLSRFDTLFANDVKVKRQILIIPTWRDWIIDDESFFESEYFARYKNLINSDELHKLAKQYDFDILFCLHPNMQKYSQYFEHPEVRVIRQGEIDVQHLIKESALMLTDYSSVGFDFSFLHKPVIYYQFDRSRFIGKRPSHLDLDNDLPGEICFEEEEVLALIREYCQNNFQMKEEYRRRANKFIKYRDRNACERIFHVIQNNKAERSFIQNPKLLLIRQAVYRKFRRSKYYFPTMKLFYKIGSKIVPVDKNLILFESGLGKQYADSPRYIYEEILRQNLDYKKVWVYNKQHRFSDAKTKRIQRLSPQYYFYLLRAGYWVNNQNFPTYIKKRPQTTYLQTWHGTPLKKMLYDLDEVYGRNADYVERVGNAVKNWDYLISPSPYASKVFRSAFRYDQKILEVGYPRNDIFYKPEKDIIARKVKNKLHLPKDKKIILYAPTFRDHQTNGKNKFTFDLQMNLERMKEELGDEYIILLRLHVVIQTRLKLDENIRDFAYDVSNYPDIQELMLIADILITDYSSVMFDFANTNRPMIFFTYDLEEYRDRIRGFYLDFEKEAPGPFVFNTEEIIQSIKNIDKIKEQYKEKYRLFQENYCPLEDGKASKRVVDLVFKK